MRSGRRDDAAAAARLWIQSAEEHTAHDPIYEISPDAERTMRKFMADLTSSSLTFMLVAVVEEEIVGFVSGDLREGSPTFQSRTWASVDDIYVSSEYRSLGIGRALLRHVESWARDKGADGISLQVAAANGRGRHFYQDLGFREVSVYQVLEF